MKHNPPRETLQDKKQSNGKLRPWHVKKPKGYGIVESFLRLGDMARAEKLLNCGTFLEFLVNLFTGEKRLHWANFCKDRLCPMCNWRRSLKLFSELFSVVTKIMGKRENWRPILLTLTVRNCAVDTDALSSTLDILQTGWNRLLRLKGIKGVFKGFFRTVEITYNKETGEFHPHIHALVFVEESYFTGDSYIETAELVKLWRAAARLDYNPICDMRKIKNIEKGISEVAKYVVKDTDMVIQGDNDMTDRIVSSLSESLHGRRLYAYGGEMKQVAAELDSDEDDLVHVGDAWNNSNSGFTVIERYRWDFNINRHILVSRDKRDSFENSG